MDQLSLALMNQIMDVICTSDKWERIQATNPIIATAGDEWMAALAQVKPLLPRDLYTELEDAHTREVVVSVDAAILYGIHVADTIREATANPNDLSRYMLTKYGGQG